MRGESVDRQDDNEEQRRFNKIVASNYLPYISQNVKSLLEIGSYKGFTVKALKDMHQFNKIDGIDLSQDAIEFSKKLVGIDTLL
ncbi:MAG: hypothetical protein IPP29_15855 [Bacteroidetes bacterium]|nr:hypothetical protein [Bacteroidota bacterium]